MIYFTRFILKIFIITLSLVFLTDSAFNYVFFNFHKRTKQDLKNKNYDLLFLGSSRCFHSINAILFQKITNYSTYNLGSEASHARENYAALKVYLKHNKSPKFVILQLDHSEDADTLCDDYSFQFFVKFYQMNIIDDYFSKKLNWQLKLPLYKNMIFKDLGWRELLKSLFQNSYNNNKNGFGGKIGTHILENKKFLLKTTENRNIWISKITELCEVNNKKLIIFTAPIFGVQNPEKLLNLNKYGTPYFNYADMLIDKKFYFDEWHINTIGADSLTKIIALDFLKNNN
jgi:hypothetical protein